MAPTPEPSPNGSKYGLKGWISDLNAIAREGGPATLLLMLILGGLTLWFLNAELKRQQDLTVDLVHQLLVEKDKRVELALRCADGSKTSGAIQTGIDGLPYGNGTQ